MKVEFYYNLCGLVPLSGSFWQHAVWNAGGQVSGVRCQELKIQITNTKYQTNNNDRNSKFQTIGV